MKVPMNHDFVTVRLQVAQPADEIAVVHRDPAVVIVWDHEERRHTHAVPRQLGNDLLRDRPGCRSHVVDRDHERIILGRSGGKYGEGSRRGSSHDQVVSSRAATNKRKAAYAAPSADDLAKFGRTHRLHGQSPTPQECHLLQPRISLDFLQRDRPLQRLRRNEIDRAPVALLRRRIGICGARDFGETEDGFVRHAVIIEDLVAHLHRAQIIARGVIAHARPARAAVFDEIAPRVGRRLLFHEPVFLHAFS